ncbi:hypothetical protein ACJX0J_007693, partial [Zea mays]
FAVVTRIILVRIVYFFRFHTNMDNIFLMPHSSLSEKIIVETFFSLILRFLYSQFTRIHISLLCDWSEDSEITNDVQYFWGNHNFMIVIRKCMLVEITICFMPVTSFIYVCAVKVLDL